MIVLGTAALLAFSCTKDINERTIHEGSGLGFPQKVYTLEAEAGQLAIPVIATRAFSVTTEASWITVPQTAVRDSWPAIRPIPRCRAPRRW